MTAPTRTTGRDSAPLGGRRRLTYFHGQLLSAQDLRQEQTYFRARHRLHNLALHGHGVAYGLWTRPVPTPSGHCPDPEHAAPWLEVTDGLALDRVGDEVIVGRGARPRFDLWSLLDDHERIRAEEDIRRGAEGVTVYLRIHHCEEPVDNVRAVHTEGCEGVPHMAYAHIREGFALRATTCEPDPEPCDPPHPDTPGCGDDRGYESSAHCGDGRVLGPGVLLARVERVRPDRPLHSRQVHPEVRRPLSRRPATVITSIGWPHGGRLTTRQARRLLGTDGVRIRFSRRVRTDTLRDPGVADLFQITGGHGVHGTVLRLETRIDVGGSGATTGTVEGTDEGGHETTDVITIRQTDSEYLNDGDRILLVLRTPFVLDVCGDPVDGTHVGGLVPRPGGPIAHRTGLLPPDGSGPRTSGTGQGGAGVFESWIFIDNKRPRPPDEDARDTAGNDAGDADDGEGEGDGYDDDASGSDGEGRA
ncbi:hypothetical protein ACQEV9_45030 [Streptomyces chartreusis]|uniref:hypothetical protein n=1 Tax=Streptomyces chartreusis TaxID=1969 RepID=UPI003D8C7749